MEETADLETLQAELAELEKEAADAAAEKLRSDLQALASRLQGEISYRQGLRRPIEARWLAAIKMYNANPEKTDSQEYGSRVTIPLVRRLCNIVEPRLVDLLFPTEERGFSVEPTPVPELSDAQGLVDKLPPHTPVGPDGVPASSMSMALREQREEAKVKALNMQRQIDDRFTEANYPLKARKTIHQGIVLGTGVIKGPHVVGRVKKKWSINGSASVLQIMENLDPTVEWVDVWDYFPDMTARCPEESESDFERKRLSASGLAKLAQQPGFESAAESIREAIRSKATKSESQRDQIRAAAGAAPVNDNSFTVWIYQGPLTIDELRACGVECDDDELIVKEGVVWFLDGGPVLKASLNPMDTDARPYSVFNWDTDEASIFGYGIPDNLADLYAAANSTVRAMLDNQGLTAKPQIALNREKMTPLDGTWEITPGKLWAATDKSLGIADLFAFYQIDSKANEFIGVFNLIKQLIDEIGGPMLAMQGQDSPALLKTDLGKSIANTAANVWMRRAVRNWDDQVTSPLVQRFIDWEMQYNPDPSIKGDCRAQARGTSALLEAEGQAQKLTAFIQLISADLPLPIRRKIALYRMFAQALRVDSVDILPDDDEARQLEEAEKQNAGQQQPMDPSAARIKIAEMEMKDREEQRAHEAQMLAEKGKQLQMQIDAKIQSDRQALESKSTTDEFKTVSQGAMKEQELAHDAKKFNAELMLKQAEGLTANYGLDE